MLPPLWRILWQAQFDTAVDQLNEQLRTLEAQSAEMQRLRERHEVEVKSHDLDVRRHKAEMDRVKSEHLEEVKGAPTCISNRRGNTESLTPISTF